MIKLISNILFATGFIILLLTFGPVARDEIWYQLKEKKGQELTLDEGYETDTVFGRLLTARPLTIEPVNTSFSIVIEKIGVNAPIVADVSVTDEKSYNNALRNGIAHAGVSDYPTKKGGDVYLFAHSSTNFWQMGKYANVFNLLRKVEVNDRVHVFYENSEYVYNVSQTEILPGWNTYPLTRPQLGQTLTLQTCHPPGTTLNRLVVTADLIEVRDANSN